MRRTLKWGLGANMGSSLLIFLAFDSFIIVNAGIWSGMHWLHSHRMATSLDQHACFLLRELNQGDRQIGKFTGYAHRDKFTYLGPDPSTLFSHFDLFTAMW